MEAPSGLLRHKIGPVAAGVLAAAVFAGPAVAGQKEDAVPLSELPSEFLSRDDLSQKDLKRVRKVTEPAEDFGKPESFEAMPGGATTSRKRVNRDAFSHPSANLSFEGERDFRLGNALFRKLWVSSHSSTQASDGLGPLFNARSCQSCHLNDGRGHPPEADDDATSMFLRLARNAETDSERKALVDYLAPNFPDPVYGSQLQDKTVPGLKAEGRMAIRYEEVPAKLGDGSFVSLRMPEYSVTDLAYGALDPDTTISPRIAPPMIGMGLIEAIHPADIAALADPRDKDANGISGKMQLVRDPVSSEVQIGRFGWKAQKASIRDQSASAFAGDIGISTPDMPAHHGDCSERQVECMNSPTGVQMNLGDTEGPDPVLDLVTFYSQNLAVPARRDVNDEEVLRGKQMFYSLGCTSCHHPKFVTRRDAGQKAHAFQLIWPYSDFLLHDMGEGLADGQQVGRAGGREWRTQPLWGIGLTETVSGHTFFLHDGRARNLTEAILWHGGEAQSARDGFADLVEEDRKALIEFLESL